MDGGIAAIISAVINSVGMVYVCRYTMKTRVEEVGKPDSAYEVLKVLNVIKGELHDSFSQLGDAVGNHSSRCN
jgi:hypothetical protein